MKNYFAPDEFKCKCGCGLDVKQEVKDRANHARELAGIPFSISSGARCPQHNKNEKGAPDSAHISGEAIDVRTGNDAYKRFKILKALLDAGFTGIDCSHDAYVHGDIAHKPGMCFNYKGNLKK